MTFITVHGVALGRDIQAGKVVSIKGLGAGIESCLVTKATPNDSLEHSHTGKVMTDQER